MCEACHGNGVVQDKLFPGAILIRPCNCPAAVRNREQAERELMELLEAVRRELKENAVVGPQAR